MDNLICGTMSLTVTTIPTFMTYTYVYNSVSSDRRIDINPTLNTEIGEYTVDMTLTLDEANYSSISTSFSF